MSGCYCYAHQLGPTPLVPVSVPGQSHTIWCKLEFMNPSGSIKDRIATYILEKAKRNGTVTDGSWVVEASSGSTSIAMALACAQLGLRFVAVMPEGVSNERCLMIKALGAEVVLSESAAGIQGSLDLAAGIEQDRAAFFPRQFSNTDNAAAHRFITAQEVLNQIPGGRVDAVVSGVGTGGTLVGLFHGFVDHGCQVQPVAVKPTQGNAVTEIECCSFSQRIPGVVDGMSHLYQPEHMAGLVVEQVADDEALALTRQLIALGFPVGPSSGLNLAASLITAARLDADAQVVTVFPDRMERYFSTELFAGMRT